MGGREERERGWDGVNGESVGGREGREGGRWRREILHPPIKELGMVIFSHVLSFTSRPESLTAIDLTIRYIGVCMLSLTRSPGNERGRKEEGKREKREERGMGRGVEGEEGWKGRGEGEGRGGRSIKVHKYSVGDIFCKKPWHTCKLFSRNQIIRIHYE